MCERWEDEGLVLRLLSALCSAHTMSITPGDGPLEFCHTFFSTWFFKEDFTPYFRLCERQADAPLDIR